MRKNSYIAVILLTLMMFGTDALKAQEKVLGPIMDFEGLMHDFGEISEEDDGVHLFLFTNTGNAPLVIYNVESSCSCSVPDWPKEPIFPGDSSSLKVTYDTSKKGSFLKHITVMTNAIEGTVELTIKGEVK